MYNLPQVKRTAGFKEGWKPAQALAAAECCLRPDHVRGGDYSVREGASWVEAIVTLPIERLLDSSAPHSVIVHCMDLADIRKLVIVAMFSDDVLFNRLVLKGGNAISLVYGYGNRGSLDVDFSIDGDFDNLEEAETRIKAALIDRFRSVGYVLFDYSFVPRPSVVGSKGDRWGGYRAQFKIIEVEKHNRLGRDLEAARRNAAIIGPSQKRNFTIDLSKWEFCEGKVSAELQDYAIYVYTPAMLLLEKVRAICQQMAEYELRTEKSARARDFYDIYVLMKEASIDLATEDTLELARQIFAAKEVPLDLISRMPNYREFHRPDWPSVQDTVGARLGSFDFYFDFVLEITRALEPLWKV